MVINVLSSHRFHLLDLARELIAQGHDVRYYSYVPARRCAEFGIPRSACRGLLWLTWPYFLIEKFLSDAGRHRLVWYRNKLMDRYLARTMRRCDVLIALGYVYHDSLLSAKQRFGALTILEWGSKHISEQLKLTGRTDFYSQRQLSLDLHKYEVCDYLSVPASHAVRSFVSHGISAEKIFSNPYGVDFSQFYPTTCSGEFDLLYVGGWRFEKGCDLITALCERYQYRFLHVGSLVNMPFPELPNMTHVDAVDQGSLVNYYQRARVFILPSRAEGLAMVQVQAIACGLPVVCSAETGGIDLQRQLTDRRWIIEMKDLTVESLHECVEAALSLASTQSGVRNYAGKDIDNFSWSAYGRRYHQFLNQKQPHSLCQA